MADQNAIVPARRPNILARALSLGGQIVKDPRGRSGAGFIVFALSWIGFRAWLKHGATPFDDLVLALSVTFGVHLLHLLWLRDEAAKENQAAVKEAMQSQFVLLRQAQHSGLVQLFPSRIEAMKEIAPAIENARDRTWILGIALKDIMAHEKNGHPKLLREMEKRLRRDEEQGSGGRDSVRLLALDPLKSPAAFRMMLEMDARQVSQFVRSLGRRYDKTGLFNRFISMLSVIDNMPHLKKRLRFYGHTPLGWMVIVDNVMYYQPYCFGQKPEDMVEDVCIGDALPVFKFIEPLGASADDPSERRSSPFEILEQHFQTLWFTADTDLFHMEARMADKDRIIRQMFTRRENWFLHVGDALEGLSRVVRERTGGQDNRRETRFAFGMNGNVAIEVCSTHGAIGATLMDCSASGLCLTINSSAKGARLIKEGDTMTVRRPTGSPNHNARQAYLVDHICGVGQEVPYFVTRAELKGTVVRVGLKRGVPTAVAQAV